MSRTILILLGGLAFPLIGMGLLGTLLGVRAGMEVFGDLKTGLIMAGYYAGYVAGTLIAPRIIRNVGHIRSFAAFTAVAAATSLAFGLIVDPWFWLVLRAANGLCVVGLYMVVESWLNAQSAGPARGRIFSAYMASTLVALGAGPFLLLAGDTSGQSLFAITAILICVGSVPVAVTRVNEPRIDATAPLPIAVLLRISPLGAVGAFGANDAGGLGDVSGGRSLPQARAAGAATNWKRMNAANSEAGSQRRAARFHRQERIRERSGQGSCPFAIDVLTENCLDHHSPGQSLRRQRRTRVFSSSTMNSTEAATRRMRVQTPAPMAAVPNRVWIGGR